MSVMNLDEGAPGVIVSVPESVTVTLDPVPAVHYHYGDGAGGPVAWGDITGRPTTFPPETHGHPEYQPRITATDNDNGTLTLEGI